MGSKHKDKDSKRKRDDHDTDSAPELLEKESKTHKKVANQLFCGLPAMCCARSKQVLIHMQEKVKDKREKKLLKEAKKFLKQSQLLLSLHSVIFAN